jgi:hypothetical protein
VSWQEELRKLDEELAAGQISADDYRVRRDQVLSSAVSPAQPPPGATQFIQQPPPAPTPPAPQPQAPQPQGPPPQGEHTQIVGGPGDADKTQIVPGAPGDRTQQVGGWQTARPQGEDADRTQVVPGVPPQRMAGGGTPRPAPGQGPFPPHPGYQQPWQQQEEEYGPPWAGADFPPLAAPASPDWIKQGPEVFELDRKSRTGRVALIIVLVLVLAGLGTGGYFLINRNKDSGANPAPPAQTTTSRPAPTTRTSPPRPKDDLEVAALPGRQEPTDHIKTFADAENSGGFLTPDELQTYKQAEAGKSRMVAAVLPNGAHAFVFTTETASPAKAVAARDALAMLQIRYGLKEYPNPPPGVPTEEIAKAGNNPNTIRAHYTHKGTVVRIQVFGDDQTAVRDAYLEVITLQLKELAADA